MINIESSK